MARNNYDVCVSSLRDITDEIAASTVAQHGNPTLISLKERVDDASRWAKQKMRAALSQAYPNIGWMDEWADPDPDGPAGVSEYWVYDPIDGAYHYLQGLPLWSGSLALVSNRRTIFSAVYDPAMKEMFIGIAGEPTRLEHRTIEASLKTDLATAVLGTSLPPFVLTATGEHELAIDLIRGVSPHVFVLRQMASASLQLAYVAAGRLDGYFEAGSDIHDWLAGALLVEGAGGRVTGLDGHDFDWGKQGILAATEALMKPIAAITTHCL